MEAFSDSPRITSGMDFQILVRPPPGGVGSWSAEMRVPERWVALAPDLVSQILGEPLVIGRGLDAALAVQKLLERFGAGAALVALSDRSKPSAPTAEPPPEPEPEPASTFIERLGRSPIVKRLRELLVDYSMDSGGGPCEPGPVLLAEIHKLACAKVLLDYILDKERFYGLTLDACNEYQRSIERIEASK